MAEQQPARDDDDHADRAPDRRRQHSSDGGGRRTRSSRTPSSERQLTAAEAAKSGLRQISELTGKRPEGVTGVERDEDGWTVGVEVVEDRRIPSSTDILATYEAELDAGGEIVSYRRLRRYPRGHGDAGEG